jgi:hypothetical protein
MGIVRSQVCFPYFPAVIERRHQHLQMIDGHRAVHHHPGRRAMTFSDRYSFRKKINAWATLYPTPSSTK